MSAAAPIEFSVPGAFALEGFAAALEQSFSLRIIGHHELMLTQYDSFDWRLHRAGLVLAIETIGEEIRLVYITAKGAGHARLPVPAVPRWANDLPEGEIRDRLAEVLEMRALLPQAVLHGQCLELASVEGTATDHGSAWALESFAVEKDGDRLPLPIRLRWTPAKGQRRESRELMERLAAEFGLQPAQTGLFAAAHAALGITPSDPSALWRGQLDPAQRADAAVKQVLRNLLDTIRLNESGVKAETDTEFLHDFRVAVRRTRSALGQIKQIFPQRTVQGYARRFHELGQITGEPRDMDVYLLDFDRYLADLPEPLRAALEPLRELLQRRAISSHACLNHFLESAAYRRLIRNWGNFLDLPPPRKPQAPNALLPIGELASRRIWKLYRRLLREGEAITPDTPPDAIHELRKTAKKLRYLMEFFRSLYPQDKIGPLVKILKSLQDHLGAYQDVHVQISHLRQFSDELRTADVATNTLLALGALLERLYEREQALRDSFSDAFGKFAERDHRRKFKHLFGRSAFRRDLALPAKADRA